MKFRKRNQTRGGLVWRLGLGLLSLVLSLCPALGQLAITEVMSGASTTFGGLAVTRNSDYWELTNFGTNSIPLDGYIWNDVAGAGGFDQGDKLPFENPTIQPGESILFVQTDTITNPDQFREWWGAGLPEDVRIYYYVGHGFSTAWDGVRLWDSDRNLVASVDFGEALRGRSFTYDPETGFFGVPSRAGVEPAFKAETRDDEGSPGLTTGRVPLWIVTPPSSLTVCVGIDATFTVQAGGLPRPHYRWFFNRVEIPGATSPTLKLPNPQRANAGTYRVVVSNGFGTIESPEVTLAVSDEPAAPRLFQPVADVEVLIMETARFFAPVCANPPGKFQWFADGVPLAGETNRTLAVPDCQLAQSGTRCCVVVSNRWGVLNECAQLTVRPKPRLLITEVMAAPSTDCPEERLHGDWFELTNFDTNAVNLQGYRFANVESFEDVYVVEQPLTLAPGQSAIFVEQVQNMKPEAFRSWWGEALPPDLPILMVPAFGLKQPGEAIYVWSAGAEDPFNPNSKITSLSYASADFGVSFYFDEGDCFWGCPSVDGELGAFRSVECGDLGSPGYTAAPALRLIGIVRDARGVTVRWRAVAGRQYRIEAKTQFTSSWAPLASQTAAGGVQAWTDAGAGGASPRFYRVVEVP